MYVIATQAHRANEALGFDFCLSVATELFLGQREPPEDCDLPLSRGHLLPKLCRESLRINLENLTSDSRLLAMASPFEDHRILMPDHDKRNH